MFFPSIRILPSVGQVIHRIGQVFRRQRISSTTSNRSSVVQEEETSFIEVVENNDYRYLIVLTKHGERYCQANQQNGYGVLFADVINPLTYNLNVKFVKKRGDGSFMLWNEGILGYVSCLKDTSSFIILPDDGTNEGHFCHFTLEPSGHESYYRVQDIASSNYLKLDTTDKIITTKAPSEAALCSINPFE